MTDESFRGLVLELRGRTGLTQREFAALVGVSVHSIQGWEAGANFPGLASLKALITATLRAGGFTSGDELAEIRVLWAAALRDAPRFRTPFDAVWASQITAEQHPATQVTAAQTSSVSPTLRVANPTARRQSWGGAPDVATFVGRASERALFSRWIHDERSRLVAVLGLGGIGKSMLATRVAHDLAPSFERIFWRSLRDSLTPDEWLGEVIGFLAPNDPGPG